MKPRLYVLSIASLLFFSVGTGAQTPLESEKVEALPSSGRVLKEDPSAKTEASKSLIASLRDNETVKGLASQIDFSKLSWKDISSVPYSDKDELVKWANSQVGIWSGRLKEAGVKEGGKLLNNLGDTGWQGSLKKVKASIEAVEKSSPGTYEAARSALASSWEVFSGQAGKLLGS